MYDFIVINNAYYMRPSGKWQQQCCILSRLSSLTRTSIGSPAPAPVQNDDPAGGNQEPAGENQAVGPQRWDGQESGGTWDQIKSGVLGLNYLSYQTKIHFIIYILMKSNIFYRGDPSPQRTDFCRKMLSLRGIILRKWEIETLESTTR